MATVPRSESVAPSAPLNLLLQWPQRRSTGSWTAIAAIAAACQAFFFSLLLQMANISSAETPERTAKVTITHLYLPRDLMTQRAPNRTAPAVSVDLADLLPSRETQAQRAAAESSRKHFEVPKPVVQQPKVAPQIQPQAPNLAVNQAPVAQLPPGAANGLPAPAPPPPKTQPNNPFQDVGSDSAVPNPHPTLLAPKATVDGAIQSLAKTPNARRLVVTDDNYSRPMPGAPGSGAQPGAQHVQVELKSDADAPDFRAYLARILTVVRANWRRVTPESVRLGTLRGENTVELIIDRDGQIPKLVIGQPSNVEALDQASVAGVSMSNPLPPLPDDFKGQQVRLAFTFKYNMPQ